jgi:hypothetical protein
MLMKGKRMKKTKRRNTLLLSRVTSLLKGKEKILCFMCCEGAVLAPFLEAFVTNCMETLLEAKEGKYLYTY